jgi:hypothetical protein
MLGMMLVTAFHFHTLREDVRNVVWTELRQAVDAMRSYDALRDGHPGVGHRRHRPARSAGKSTIAEQLAAALERAVVVHTDDLA